MARCLPWLVTMLSQQIKHALGPSGRKLMLRLAADSAAAASLRGKDAAS
ncbi:MAG TPA: hypothetical protein VGD98_10260 [Ktedonobacteraceae bacterium]